jgi:RepB DNA-primase from phage plasmid
MTSWTGLAAAKRHISLLYGDEAQPVALRLLRKGSPAQSSEGALDTATWEWLVQCQTGGYQVYIRPNRGGWKDGEITQTYAYCIDGDDIPMPEALDWHLTPDFVVSRSATRWQAWWTTGPREVFMWREGQLRLAAHYGTDKMVATPATLMRLAGTLNLKDPANPVPYTLTEFG